MSPVVQEWVPYILSIIRKEGSSEMDQGRGSRDEQVLQGVSGHQRESQYDQSRRNTDWKPKCRCATPKKSWSNKEKIPQYEKA